jgi:rod shape-determining protein MreD
MERVLIRGAWFVGLFLVQVFLLNNISLFGVATPFLYIYLILVSDKYVDRIALMLLAFALGLVVDVFSNTPGVNAAASVLVAFLRPGMLRLFTPRDEFENFEPGIHTLGLWSFVRYAAVFLLVHHAAVFLLESFSLAHIGYLMLRIVCGTLVTLLLVVATEFIRHQR